MATTDRQGAAAQAVLVIGSGAGLFAAFCPSWFTVRSNFFSEQDARAGNVQAIRQGETVATVLTLAMGWGASAVAGSPVPLVASVVVSAAMVAGYEYSMRHPATEAAQEARDAARPVGAYRYDAAPVRAL